MLAAAVRVTFPGAVTTVPLAGELIDTLTTVPWPWLCAAALKAQPKRTAAASRSAVRTPLLSLIVV